MGIVVILNAMFSLGLLITALALIWWIGSIWLPSPRLVELNNRRCKIDSLKKRRGFEEIPEFLREELESAAELVEQLMSHTVGDKMSMPEELENIDRVIENVEQRLPPLERRRSNDYDPLIGCD